MSIKALTSGPALSVRLAFRVFSLPHLSYSKQHKMKTKIDHMFEIETVKKTAAKFM